MFRQAVRTLTGGNGDPNPDAGTYEDVFELGHARNQEPEPQAEQDGHSDEQNVDQELRATVQRLSQNFEVLNQRLSEKDRYIGQLEGENRTLRTGPAQSVAGRQPEKEPDPVLDNATAALFAEKYKENPEEALVALADHLDTRNQARLAQVRQQDARVQQVASKLQGIERNIIRQVDLAIRNYGPAAEAVVGDFVDLVRRGNASAQEYGSTWLGRELAADRPLAETTGGVYRLIELAALRNAAAQTGGEVTEPQAYRQPAAGAAATGIRRPTAPNRTIVSPSDGSGEIPLEDRIGDAIVEAAKGDDAAIQSLFKG